MSKATLLIVEDEAVVAEDLVKQLSQLDYAISGLTARGEEAVTLTRDRRPDLVLMDIRLSGPMDGVATAEIIRREYDVPVIYLTAHSDAATLERAKLTEPFGYILKPFEETELETHIQMALHKHQTERKLFETHQRLQALLQALPVGVSFTDDASCQRITGNPTFLAQFEVGPQDNLSASALDANAAGRQVRYFENGREISQAELPLQRAVAENRAIPPTELEIQLPSGRRWYAEVAGAPIRSPRGKVTGGVAITADITARKLAELALAKASAEQRRLNRELKVTNRELQTSNEELNTTNEELNTTNEELQTTNEELQTTVDHLNQTTKELHTASESLEARNKQLATVSEQLRLGNEQLEIRVLERTAQLRALAGKLTQSEERERRRIAKILHDHLQQLLVGARLRVEVVRAHPESKPMRKDLQRIEELISESVDVARGLSHDLSPPILYEAGLAAALQWLATWMRQNHGLSVHVQADIAAEPLEENVKVLVFQSVRELLFNVVKHAGVKRAAVRMGLGRDDELEIAVSDRGKGFDPAQARTGSEAATGFGLFSIRERLQLLGGLLEVKSKPGQGSRFLLRAPLHEPPQARMPAAVAARPPRAKKLPAVKRLRRPTKFRRAAQGKDAPPAFRVLLADDHKIVRDGLSLLLEQEPAIEVVGLAADGEEAIAMVEQLEPDLVVMDVGMSPMDGIEATRQITAAWPHIKVIGLTMHVDPSRHEAIRAAGAVKCLVKTGPAKDLLAAIRTVITAAPRRSKKGPPPVPAQGVGGDRRIESQRVRSSRFANRASERRRKA